MLSSSLGSSFGLPAVDALGFEKPARPRAKNRGNHHYSGMGEGSNCICAMRILLYTIDIRRMPTARDLMDRFNVSRAQAYRWIGYLAEALEVDKPARATRHGANTGCRTAPRSTALKTSSSPRA